MREVKKMQYTYICAYTNVYVCYSDVGKDDCGMSVKAFTNLFYSESKANAYL